MEHLCDNCRKAKRCEEYKHQLKLKKRDRYSITNPCDDYKTKLYNVFTYAQLNFFDKLGLLRRDTDTAEEYHSRILNWWLAYCVLTVIAWLVANGTVYSLINQFK